MRTMLVFSRWPSRNLLVHKDKENFIFQHLRPAALRSYSQNVPHYPLPNYQDGIGNIAQAFTLGSTRIVLPDLRSEAKVNRLTLHTGPTRDIDRVMSTEQMDWLLSELLMWKNYSLMILVSSRAWIGPSQAGEDSWAGFSEDRKLVSDFIATHNITNLVMVAGSTHMLAMDDGSHTDYSDMGGAGFPLIQAAPLDRWGSTSGGPFSHGCYTRLGDYNSHYAVLEIIDNSWTNRTCVHVAGKRVYDGLLIDWSKCTPLLINGSGGMDGTCTGNVDIIPPTAWASYAIGLTITVFLFVICVVGYYKPYIRKSRNRSFIMFSSVSSLVLAVICIALFPILRLTESSLPIHPLFLPVHSSYALLGISLIYMMIVLLLWNNSQNQILPEEIFEPSSELDEQKTQERKEETTQTDGEMSVVTTQEITESTDQGNVHI
eukprot:TRINITY_DN9049_c0_g2_i16.p1 TRINITY_DN9049_c0_g2~~TRINITY_DN9049_c0_g2_i16.p1  ORF type:complete len:431 (-),score=66.69 TRINITY_DN9049_c0_g2_i16:114-1406(-)